MQGHDSHRPLACIEIGTNSVQLLVAQVQQGVLRKLAGEKYSLQLSHSLKPNGALAEQCVQYLLEVVGMLLQIAQAYQARVFLFATQILRTAQNTPQIIAQIERLYCQRIEVLPGHEEAFLSGLAMRYALALPESCCFLGVDIGGGSTEVVWMRGAIPQASLSLPVGHLNLLPRGNVTTPLKKKERKQVQQKVLDLLMQCRLPAFEAQAYVLCSGVGKTLASLFARAAPTGLECDLNGQSFMRQELKRLAARLYADPQEFQAMFAQELTVRRAKSLLPGVLILEALTQHFSVPSWTFAMMGVREGVLLREIRRAGCENLRSWSFRELATRFGVDDAFATLLCRRCLHLFELLRQHEALPQEVIAMESPRPGELRASHLLQICAVTSEWGKQVHLSKYPRHSCYLSMFADIPGLSPQQRQVVAVVNRFARKGHVSRKHLEASHLPLQQLRLARVLAALLKTVHASLRTRQECLMNLQLSKQGVLSFTHQGCAAYPCVNVQGLQTSLESLNKVLVTPLTLSGKADTFANMGA
ncbi:MAG: hypothetical protein OXT67_00085 [Zetaproteobacteria bacterium]|nr:hypothetical protein [Zetaproteobacteria bacterium]